MRDYRKIWKLFYARAAENEIRQKAYAVAFNFTLSIFPATIFFFNLIPYFPIENLEMRIFTFLESILPESFMLQIESTIMDIVERQRTGLLSIVFIIALYLSTNGMMALMSAFNSMTKKEEKRSYLRQQLIATFLVIIAAIVLVASFTLLVVSNDLIKLGLDLGWIEKGQDVVLINMFRFLVVVIIFLFTTSMVYRFAPFSSRKWRLISPGTSVATILIIISSVVLSIYIDLFETYNFLYGSIGAILGVMFWMFLIAFSLLIGFQLNVTINELDDAVN